MISPIHISTDILWNMLVRYLKPLIQVNGTICVTNSTMEKITRSRNLWFSYRPVRTCYRWNSWTLVPEMMMWSEIISSFPALPVFQALDKNQKVVSFRLQNSIWHTPFILFEQRKHTHKYFMFVQLSATKHEIKVFYRNINLYFQLFLT
jgi:hypothetical protein